MFRFFVFFVLPIGACCTFLFLQLKSSLPPTIGTIQLKGLHEPVKISHDAFGTPRIVAKTDRDAYFSIGFKHASDRLWQLEVQRRLAQGRLSEVLGAKTLPQDIWMRTLGIQDAAKQSAKFLTQDTIDALMAYSDGINAWLSQASSLPIEFRMLGFKPEPWTMY